MRAGPRLVAAGRGGITLRVDPGAPRQGAWVAFTDRNGGVSAPPFDTLNLAARVGDVPEAVARNRALWAGAAGFDLARLALARQVHGADVLEIEEPPGGVAGDGDVLVTRRPGTVIAMLTADCAAVAVAGGGGVAIAHAGWRGLVAGAVEAAAAAVTPVHAVWIGPAIRACCYEVGPEVVAAFERRGLPVAAPGRVDIALAAAAAARAAGAPAIALAGGCTHCDPDYFSFRRDGTTGRQAGAIALAPAS